MHLDDGEIQSEFCIGNWLTCPLEPLLIQRKTSSKDPSEEISNQFEGKEILNTQKITFFSTF